MNVGVGSLEWARRTGGRITVADQIGQAALAVGYQLQVLPKQFLWRLGLRKQPQLKLDLDGLVPPDSKMAKDCEEMCIEASGPSLANHCFRSYLWARVLADGDGITFDDEFLYVACLTHDLGLTDAYRSDAADVHCFTLDSAKGASDAAEAAGWPEARSDALAESILMHINAKVGRGKGAEAHLLSSGTALDVAGLRYWDMPEAAVEKVVAKYPRLEFKKDVTTRWAAEVKAHPHSRACFLQRYAQFETRIHKSPFKE